MSKWGDTYNTLCAVKLNYQSIGSGGGVKAFTDNTVDFGASDAYLQDSEIAAATKGTPVEIPVTFGAVVIAYNLKGLSAPLQMTPDIIANIFRHDHEMDYDPWRSPPRTGREPAVDGHQRGASGRRLGDDEHLYEVPHGSKSRLGNQGRRR
jgi:ABC-type phosphate transport system substrate-binding protein